MRNKDVYKDYSKIFFYNFWNIFWACITIWFIWSIFIYSPTAATAEEIDSMYLEEYYEGDYQIGDLYDFTLSSKIDIPISYSIAEDCGDYMKSRIRKSFIKIFEETDSIMVFIETTNNADIQIACHLLTDYYEDVYTAGEATLGIIGYVVNDATINFYNLESKTDTWEMGACDEYPDTEIHEILHTFGFDHNYNENSIMLSFSKGCYIDSIDNYIIECLKYTYSDGENGDDCSYRDDVIGSLEEVEYEYYYEDCDYGLYDAINTDKFCCQEPNMYIDNDGYCY